jgi:DNA-binding NarL/FixJ family response regulator
MNKILIATRERLPADMIKLLINDKKDEGLIEVIHNGRDALNFIIEQRPRVIMLDLFLPLLSAIAVMEELDRINLYPRVICLCNEISRMQCVKLFKAGISGLIDYNTSIDGARKIFQQVEAGKVLIPDLIEKSIGTRDFEINHKKYAPLTLRQLEIIHLTGEGYSNGEISLRLNISKKTVEKHKSVIRDKIGLASASQLAVYAITHGFVKVKEVACL